MMPIPIIKLEVEHMRQEMRVAIGRHFDLLEAETDKALKKAIEGFDFEGVVAEAAKSAVQECVEKAVQHAVVEAFYEDDIKGIVREAVKPALFKHLGK